MKILWLINLPLPEASALLKEEPSPFGGWLINASKMLSLQKDVELTVAFPSNKAKKINEKPLKGERIKYYPFSPIKYKNLKAIEDNEEFKNILQETTPDLVHIYGTEYSQTLSMINSCRVEGIKTVISIQGLVSIYSNHIYASLPYRAIYGFTVRNLFLKDNIHEQKKTFELRGKNEIEALKKTNHIIGRTNWDKASVSQINPNAKYHFCNETLREEFYKQRWNIEKCEPYSIFLSQGQYSIKGFHYMLEAMPIILKQFPNTKLYISGKDITNSSSTKDKLLLTYYGKYINKKIKKLNLKDKINFTGSLDEKQMRQQYLKSHVFVCPSSIENSPNSLGEAMILGVPSVASYVGGIPDMLTHNREGFLYQHDAPYMLAYYVCEIFKSNNLAINFSKNARSRASNTHNEISNNERLLEVYEKIIFENE